MAEESFRDRLFNSVTRAAPEQEALEFSTEDFRYAETRLGDDSPTGQPLVFINEAKLRAEGATDAFIEKMMQGEALHNLKNIDPERYQTLKDAAFSSQEYLKWASASYERARDAGEKRSFRDWHDVSRFDQVIGGYLYAQDPDIPTMANWSREDLPFGEPLKQELEKLANDLGL